MFWCHAFKCFRCSGPTLLSALGVLVPFFKHFLCLGARESGVYNTIKSTPTPPCPSHPSSPEPSAQIVLTRNFSRLPVAAPLPCHVVFTHVMLHVGRSFHVMACYLYSCHVTFNHVILCNLLRWSLGRIIAQSDQTGK